MEGPAIILLETSKPRSFIGSQLGRVYLAPLLPLLKEDLGIPTEKILYVFEKRENIESLLQLIEKKSKTMNGNKPYRVFSRIFNVTLR